MTLQEFWYRIGPIEPGFEFRFEGEYIASINACLVINFVMSVSTGSVLLRFKYGPLILPSSDVDVYQKGVMSLSVIKLQSDFNFCGETLSTDLFLLRCFLLY